MNLKHSIVERGGVTATQWSGSTKAIGALCTNKGAVRFRFSLPSKGGGTTDIMFTLDARDLRQVLKQLAIDSPTCATALAESAYAAVRTLQRQLDSPQQDA